MAVIENQKLVNAIVINGVVMGFNFRKSFKLAPGIRLNIGKKGVSSVSIGGKGARISAGRKGTRTTLSVPGTGLSYSTFNSYKKTKDVSHNQLNSYVNQKPTPLQNNEKREVSLLLGLGILFLPYIFSWFTLKQGYSTLTRVISFAWMIFLIISLK